MAGTLLSGTINQVPSFSLIPNLLPPHNRRTLQMRTQCTISPKKQHDTKLKLVVVDPKNFYGLPKILLLSAEEEEEEDIISISSSWENGSGIPVIPYASCNELLLTEVGYNEQALWNPSTSFIKPLPQSLEPRPPFVCHEATRLYGFGFDPRASSSSHNNDYKVIRFFSFIYVDGSDSYLDDWLVELYSLSTNSWKPIPYPHHSNIFIGPTCIYINGFCYWQATYGRDLFVIIPFDFANDTFPSAFIPGPTFHSPLPRDLANIAGDVRYSFLLVEFEGSLGVIKYFTRNEKTIELELWVWNDGSWSRRRGEWVIRVPGEIDETSRRSCYLLGLFKNHLLYFQDSDKELWLFDCAKQKLKNLGVKAEECCLLSLFPFVERSLPNKDIK